MKTKRALNKAYIAFTECDMKDLPEACAAIDVDVKQIKSAPVMIVGEDIWTGADCALAVEEGEVV